MFIPPYRRFCFNKLSFRITSAPEHLQWHINEILQDLLGVVCHVDDTLLSGKDKEEHDSYLHAVLKGLKLKESHSIKRYVNLLVLELYFLVMWLMPMKFLQIQTKSKIWSPQQISGSCGDLWVSLTDGISFLPTWFTIPQPTFTRIVEGKHQVGVDWSALQKLKDEICSQ